MPPFADHHEPPRADHDLARAAMLALNEIRDVSANRIVSAQVLTRIAQLPTMLRTSGVLPTLAFYAAKGGSDGALEHAYLIVGVALRDQVSRALHMDEGVGKRRIDLDFLGEVTERLRTDPAAYNRVSVRLEQFSIWLRRLAEALERQQERAGRSPESATDGEEAPGA